MLARQNSSSTWPNRTAPPTTPTTAPTRAPSPPSSYPKNAPSIPPSTAKITRAPCAPSRFSLGALVIRSLAVALCRLRLPPRLLTRLRVVPRVDQRDEVIHRPQPIRHAGSE